MKNWHKLLQDDQGAEVLEYVLVFGLIVLAAVTVIASVGTNVFAIWSSVSSSL
jgi:Flp pilus assembly pilin Flp